MLNSGNSNKSRVFSFRLIRKRVQVSPLHHLYPALHRILLRLKCLSLGVNDPQPEEYQFFFFGGGGGGGGYFNFFMFLLQWFNVNACMGWPYYHFKPMKVLRNPWIELYAASLKSARTITRNTFSCVHLAGGENIPILGVPGDIRVYAGAFEAPVRVLAVVKGHAVNTQHVGLQVAFLRGAVGTVAALEWLLTSMTWERNRPHYHPVQCQ